MSFVLWIIGGMAFKQSHDVTMAIGSLLIALNFIYNVRAALPNTADASARLVRCATLSSARCRPPGCAKSRSRFRASLTRS